MINNDKTYAEMENDFWNAYYGKIIPTLKPFDKDRKIALAVVIIISMIIIFFLVGQLLVLVSVKTSRAQANDFMHIAVISVSVIGLIYYIAKQFIEGKLKKSIMPFVCECFSDLKWVRDISSVLNENFEEANLVDSYNNDSYDDYFVGSYRDVTYEIIECHFTYTTGCGKNRRTVTIFEGAIIRLPMNKNFKGNTVIRPNSLFHFSPSSKLKRTEMEDVEFEKKYDVYTNDEVEARYLITTAFMERLNEMKVAFNARNVSCAFYKGELLIGLHTRKDLFSIGSLFHKVYDKAQFQALFNEILSIIKLIEHFKLDQKIGL